MMLFFIFSFLSCGILCVFLTPNKYVAPLGIFISGFIFVLSTIFFFKFNPKDFSYQFILHLNTPSFIPIDLTFGFDGLALVFFILTAFLTFLCIIFVYNDKLNVFYIQMLLIIELLLLIVFTTLNILIFFLFFEAILIPMYLLVTKTGSRSRKIWAAYLLFFFTLVSSLSLAIGIGYIFFKTGTFSYYEIHHSAFSEFEECWLFVAFFLSFATKVPVFPLHGWLPEAHVEASTVGSVILAGILLKVGFYGLVRFNLIWFPHASMLFTPYVAVCCGLGVLFSSFAAITQNDLKRLIAYSSIAHMNVLVLALFAGNFSALNGAIAQTLNHAFVSSGLFFLIGILYSRYHSRTLYYYSGLVYVMPLYVTALFLFTLANVAVPGTSNFCSELLLFVGIFQFDFFLSIIMSCSVFLSGAYAFWLINRISFGNTRTELILLFRDLSLIELFTILPLLIAIFFFGINQTALLSVLQSTTVPIILNYI